MSGLPELKKLRSVPGVNRLILLSPEEIARNGKNKIREYGYVFIPRGMKRCPQCKKTKALDDFSNCKNTKDSKMTICKICNTRKASKWQNEHKEYKAEYLKEYGIKNRDYLSENGKQYRLKNKELLKEKDKQWRDDNHEALLISKKEYRIKNQAIILQKAHEYYRTHKKLKGRPIPMDKNQKRIKNRMSKGVWASLHGAKWGFRWEHLVGYSVEELMIHLENQFEEGMSWDNYGRRGWHIDHKVAVSAFHFTSFNDSEFKQCWCLENLQPLWETHNLIKNNKIYFPELLEKLTGRKTRRPTEDRIYIT